MSHRCEMLAADEMAAEGRPPTTLVLAVVGLALFLSSTWTARADASGVSTPVIYATRFVTLVVCLGMAWAFRNRLPDIRRLLALTCPAMLVHVACVLITPLLSAGPEVTLVLDYVSGVFEGVANALMTLLFTHVFSLHVPSRSALAIAISWLLTDICILFLDTLSMAVMHYARPVFTLASLAILVCCVKRAAGAADVQRQSVDRDAQPDRQLGGSHPLLFLSRHTGWLLLLIVAFLFSNLFGMIAQVSSATGGNFALFDIPTEIVMIAVQALLLTFFAVFGARFEFSTILACVIPPLRHGLRALSRELGDGQPACRLHDQGGIPALAGHAVGAHGAQVV